MDYTVREAAAQDRAWMLQTVRGWGADFVVTRGRKVYAAELPAFIAQTPEGKRVGLVTYEIVDDQCEIVTLDAFVKFSGIGTALMEHAVVAAQKAGCSRVWLLTTNDNLDGIRFYQRHRFVIAAIHVNALANSRRLKPSIPEIGDHGIPLRDEIEFELWL